MEAGKPSLALTVGWNNQSVAGAPQPSPFCVPWFSVTHRGRGGQWGLPAGHRLLLCLPQAVQGGRAKRYSSQRQRPPVPEPAPPMHISIMEGHYYDPRE